MQRRTVRPRLRLDEDAVADREACLHRVVECELHVPAEVDPVEERPAQEPHRADDGHNRNEERPALHLRRARLLKAGALVLGLRGGFYLQDRRERCLRREEREERERVAVVSSS